MEREIILREALDIVTYALYNDAAPQKVSHAMEEVEEKEVTFSDEEEANEVKRRRMYWKQWSMIYSGEQSEHQESEEEDQTNDTHMTEEITVDTKTFNEFRTLLSKYYVSEHSDAFSLEQIKARRRSMRQIMDRY